MARRNMPYGGKAVPMEPGERDKALTIEAREAPASTGGRYPQAPWSVLVAPVWMRRIDASMAERVAAEGQSGKVGTRWEMGYRADMDPELVDVPNLRRLIYQGRVFEITGASLIGQREGVELETIARSGA